MSDSEALQGLWRVESYTRKGSPSHTPATHYLISGNSKKQIVPNFVDDGRLRSTFVVDCAASPKRLTTTLDYNGPDGPPDPKPIILHQLFNLDAEVLTLCSGPFGSFPDEISDKYTILTLVRDHGPIPEPTQPSGSPPLVDEVLGTLEWDDNLNWYRGEVRVSNTSFDISLKPNDGTNASSALARAKQVVKDFERYRQLVSDYAVDGLLELKNDTWLEEGSDEVSAETFKARMTLQEIGVEADGKVTFRHSDSGLFLGHSIQVCIDVNDRCSSTDISG